jgi:hypothetical protein
LECIKQKKHAGYFSVKYGGNAAHAGICERFNPAAGEE